MLVSIVMSLEKPYGNSLVSAPRSALRCFPPGTRIMIGLDVLYALAGLMVVCLFAYLIFALIFAEKF